MNTSHDIDINLTDHGLKAQIALDGKPIDRVHGFTLTGRADHIATLELDLAVYDVSTHGDGVEVLIPDSTADALRALGWTPPRETGRAIGAAFREAAQRVKNYREHDGSDDQHWRLYEEQADCWLVGLAQEYERADQEGQADG